MIAFFTVLHVIICILLITLVLIQRGRGTGLVERFSGVESIFGPRTSVFLVRLTTTLAVLFMLSCIIMTGFSLARNRSLMRKEKISRKPLLENRTYDKQQDELINKTLENNNLTTENKLATEPTSEYIPKIQSETKNESSEKN